MSLAIIGTPASGADWDDFETQVVKGHRGYIGLSLTEFDTNTIPQIASGSIIEINGVLFTAAANESITGSASSGNINYMVATVAGSGNSQTATFGWTTTAPSWVASKHGWYGAGDGNDRYCARCYYNGTNYTAKMVYSNNLSLSDRNGNEVIAMRVETKVNTTEYTLATEAEATYAVTGFSFTPTGVFSVMFTFGTVDDDPRWSFSFPGGSPTDSANLTHIANITFDTVNDEVDITIRNDSAATIYIENIFVTAVG